MIEVLFAAALVAAVPLGVAIAVRVADPPGWATRPWARGAVALAVAGASVALFLGRGPLAAVLAGSWWLVCVALALATVVPLLVDVVAGRRTLGTSRIGVVAAVGFLVVGATWAVIDRAGLEPFGFGRTIVLLTAVHFHVAGFVLTLVGALAARERPGRAVTVAVGSLIVGTPLTALGFFGFPLVSWVGALLVAGGGIGIGAATLAIGHRVADGPARASLIVGGASLFLTMPLAAGYATGTTFGIPFLDIPAMAALHGGLNVVCFAIPTMIGWRRIVR